MSIKEESCFLDFGSANERDCFINDLEAKKVKIETSDSDTKPKGEQDSTCCSHHLMGSNETEVDIKEEPWWLEKTSCAHEEIKEETHEDFSSAKPPSVYNVPASTYVSDLFSNEDLRNDISFNMNKDNPKYESGRKYQSENNVVSDTSSTEIIVCSETSDDGEIVSMASSLKESKLLLQNNKSEPDINKEVLSHEYRKSYENDVSEKCKDPAYFQKHRLTLDSKEVNKCELQDKGLYNLSSLKTGKLIDCGKKPHKCNICDISFTVSSSLKRHKLIHSDTKLHKCSICNKGFNILSGLKRHYLIHEGVKPHKCVICNKAFTDLSGLKKHKLFHEGIKSHKCNICNKAFTMLSDLKRHKLIHEDIKAHKCNICNSAFRDSSNLKTHKLFHEGIKPHKCSICNKAFTKLSDLKRHKLIHEGIKSHKCNICNTAFTNSSSLKRHTLNHEGIKPHKCNICYKAFTRLSLLKRHELIHKDAVV